MLSSDELKPLSESLERFTSDSSIRHSSGRNYGILGVRGGQETAWTSHTLGKIAGRFVKSRPVYTSAAHPSTETAGGERVG